MNEYNWKSHFADELTLIETNNCYSHYKIANDTGSGEILNAEIFPGLQLVYNQLDMEYCSRVVQPRSDIIEISYCIDGSYECSVDNEYCFLIEPNEISVGSVGRTESNGGFPKGRYYGFTLFIEKDIFGKSQNNILNYFKIDLQKIADLTGENKQRFVMYQDLKALCIEELIRKMQQSSEMAISYLRLRILDLLALLSNPGIEDYRLSLVYLLKNQVDRTHNHIEVRTFGAFEVLVDGELVVFGRAKVKELFAFLIDQNGEQVSRKTIFYTLWENDIYDRSMQKKLDTTIRSLRSVLDKYNISKMLMMEHGRLWIKKEFLNCDMYNFLNGDEQAKKLYRGEYMSEYSWASITEAYLDRLINR